MHHTLQRLGPVEMLLFPVLMSVLRACSVIAIFVCHVLKEEYITRHGNAAHCLAMSSVSVSVEDSHTASYSDSRIRERMALVVGKVQAIVFPLSTRNAARHLGNDVGRALVGALHVAYPRAARFALNPGTDGRRHSLEGMLAGIELVCV